MHTLPDITGNADTLINTAEMVNLFGELTGSRLCKVSFQLEATMTDGARMIAVGGTITRYSLAVLKNDQSRAGSGYVMVTIGNVELWAAFTGPELDELQAGKTLCELRGAIALLEKRLDEPAELPGPRCSNCGAYGHWMDSCESSRPSPVEF